MTQSQQIESHMGIALEEACRELPGGGDSNSRRYVTQRMNDAVEAGHFSLAELHHAARNALMELLYFELTQSNA
jgi:hypothetical protein